MEPESLKSRPGQARPGQPRRPGLLERADRAERALIIITAALGSDYRLPEPHRTALRAIIDQLRSEQRLDT